MLKTVRCSYCGKRFLREAKRYNEAIKFGWKQFCSRECQNKAKFTSFIGICARPGCGKRVVRRRSEYLKFGKCFCSHTCSVLVSNSERPKKIRICATCKKEFTGRKKKYCCVECQPKRISKYTPEMIVGLIHDFVKRYNRIPLKREMIACYHPARDNFGTWNNAIKAAGYEPNPVMFAKKYIAKDGHKCDSLAERIIDDWMFRRKIKHERSVPYPSNDGFTADFKVGNYWIEFFGLTGELKSYDEHREKKLNLIKKLHIKLIDIYPKDLFPVGHIEEKLNILI